MIRAILLLAACLSCEAQLIVGRPLLVQNAPTSSANAIQSYVAGTQRNNFAGDVGFGFYASSDTISVKTLGRWVQVGNALTHTLKLKDATGTVLGSVVVNCSGATPGAFLYGSITPVTLTAGKRYFITSSETTGGDQWYDEKAPTFSTAFLAVSQGIYSTYSSGTVQLDASSGFTFGPVDFSFDYGTAGSCSTVFQSSLPMNTTLSYNNVGDLIGGGHNYSSMKITAAATKTVCSITLRLIKVGTINTTLTAILYDDSSGSPGNALTGGTSSGVATTSVSSAAAQDVVFSGLSSSITSAGTYHIVLKTSAAGDASNYIGWGYVPDTGNGVTKSSSTGASGSWAAIATGTRQLFGILN